MTSTSHILDTIKVQVRSVIPDAKVVLFGSRVYGTPTDESDWDILILTNSPINSDIKKGIHQHLFPLSVELGTFFNTLTVQEEEWVNNPAYYSLRQSIKNRMSQA